MSNPDLISSNMQECGWWDEHVNERFEIWVTYMQSHAFGGVRYGGRDRVHVGRKAHPLAET
jgi:hypothetical protein